MAGVTPLLRPVDGGLQTFAIVGGASYDSDAQNKRDSTPCQVSGFSLARFAGNKNVKVSWQLHIYLAIRYFAPSHKKLLTPFTLELSTVNKCDYSYVSATC